MLVSNTFLTKRCLLPAFFFIFHFTFYISYAQEKTKAVSSKAKKQYNVLFIMVDDLRPELNCYGEKQVISPNIDALAQRGVLFTRSYCQQAVCSPSRTSMLTGLRPDRTRIYDLVTNFRNTVPGAVALPQYFRQHGYYSVGIGKIFHSLKLEDSLSWSEKPFRPLDSMWNIQRGYLIDEDVSAALKDGTGRGPAYEAGPDDSNKEYPDDLIVKRSISKLRELKNRPFFLAVGLNKPHLPFNAPRRFWDMYKGKIQLSAIRNKPVGSPPYAFVNSGELRAYEGMPKGKQSFNDSLSLKLKQGYYACVSYTDKHIGMILDELKKLGLDDHTIIILWGDHGWKLGEYGEWCKHTNYELDTRQPLIISIPGMRNAGKKCRELVESLDIYPTLAELAGLPHPSGIDGSSLVNLMDHLNDSVHEFAVSQYPRGKLMGYSFRTERYRFTRWGAKDDPFDIKYLELYDHTVDPEETVNQAYNTDMEGIKNELLQQSNEFFRRKRNL